MSEPATDLCECGSGLTPAHCCAFARAETDPPAVGGEDLDPVVERAAEALRAGDRETAERLAIQVLEQAPERTPALAVLSEVRLAQTNRKAAAALLSRLAKLEPMNFWPVNKLALLELGRGDAQAAEPHARNAIRIAPENSQAHNLMGMAMTEMHRPVVGEYHCRKALELAGRRIPLVLANLATNLMNQGRIEEARAHYRESNEGAPHTRQTLIAWARLEEADRKLDAAHEILDRLDRITPNDPAGALVRATVLGRQKRYDEAVACLDRNAEARSRPLRPVELLERGRLLDRLGRHDDAWADFMAGKARAREVSGHVYLEDEAGDLAARLKYFFTRDRTRLLPRAGLREAEPQPIFILGFPRSGTTLVEQTLSTSPAISAGDELAMIHQIAGMMPRLLMSPLHYPEALSDLWMGDKLDGLDDLRDFYLQKARHLGVMREGAAFFTDKMPLNEVHLGLIALIFPRSPLIHVIRHPLDIMVSAMSNFFTHGGFCGTALESAAKHLVLAHGLVAHYRAEMDLRYLPVRYEDVVDDQETTVRGVFDFVGVPFDPAVLGFEANSRYARTASYAQVAEKLYDRSRFRYRHYLRHLEPVLPILAPLIERLGYTVEDAA